MKKKLSTQGLVVFMLFLTVIGYGIHYLLFRDLHHIAIFFVSDVAFLPLEVLLVSFVFHKMIENSHKRDAQGKINIIESMFFNESGSDIIRYLLTCDDSKEKICTALSVKKNWGAADYAKAVQFIDQYSFSAAPDKLDFFALHYHLSTRHKYFLKVIENPALSDNESFTDLVLEIHHLWEELEMRVNLYTMEVGDREYLAEIVSTIYRMLTKEWLINIGYIQKHHEGRFICALKANPFTTFSIKGTSI